MRGETNPFLALPTNRAAKPGVHQSGNGPIYARLQADARRAASAPQAAGPGGQPGNDSDASAAGLHPADRLFGQATPEPAPTLRAATPRQPTQPPEPSSKKTRRTP